MVNNEIRALYDNETIRVYQAYNNDIANSVLENDKFVSPPFKIDRMTWIKPSFLWMMYRSGWSMKDKNQNRILAIDISRKGFEWALKNSILSRDHSKYSNKEEWLKVKKETPVRIQWDPERDLFLNPLKYRTIQIGLSNEAVELYVNEWIKNITDITDKVLEIHSLLNNGKVEEARKLLPKEKIYLML